MTGELYVRWFQFGAFCPLFRSHGRTWKLRLPWGWNTGELGPNEIRTYGDAANPDPSELHNAAVEPICRKYLELRYRLLPYLYSVVREGHLTGLPVIRALWLHYPDDAAARARGDEYLWGPNILVAPVTEKGATSRRALSAARALVRLLDRRDDRRRPRDRPARRPGDACRLYVRAGVDPADGPGQAVHGGKRRCSADASRLSRAPTARSCSTRTTASRSATARGDWMGIDMSWDDRARRLTLKLADGSRMRPPLRRPIEVVMAPEQDKQHAGIHGTDRRCEVLSLARSSRASAPTQPARLGTTT